MTEQAKIFLNEYGNIDSSNLDEAIGEFVNLSIEDQYELWSNDKVNHCIFNNMNGGNKVKGVGIIEILNYKFPEGFEMISGISESQISRSLYCSLVSYQPVVDRKEWLGSIIRKYKYF